MSLALAQTDAAAEIAFVMDLLIVLATAATVAIAMQWLRLAVIPVYLIAGVLVGPDALGWVASLGSLQAIANLAIILLMFGIGLQLHTAVMGRSAARMVVIGGVSCAVSIMLGWPVAMGFGLAAPAALAVAMALSLSSTAVVLRLITERGELRHATGQLALSILVVQDLIVLAMLALLPAMAHWSGTGGAWLIAQDQANDGAGSWGRFLGDAGLRIGGITALIVLGRLLLPRLINAAARERSGEIMMIVCVAAALGAGLATHYLGFGTALGAFLAGFLLSATPLRHQLAGQITPLRNLFLAVFFTTLGMQVSPRVIAEGWWIVLLGGTLMCVLKALTISATSWGLGATLGMAVAVGLALAQGGEFSLVLIGAAHGQGIFSEAVAANAIAIVVISLILTPGMLDLGRWLSRRLSRAKPAPWVRRALGETRWLFKEKPRLGRHVIIGGHGEVGKAIAGTLDAAGIGYTIVEINPDAVRGVQGMGRSIVFGDVANPEVLESAGLEHADALILTMPDEQAVLAACAIARRRRADEIFIAARIALANQSHRAALAQIDHITIEEHETARAMQAAVMKRLIRITLAPRA